MMLTHCSPARRRRAGARRVALIVWLALLAALPGRGATAVPHGPDPTLLAIYILAYDNRPGSSMDLTPHYPATLSSIVAATVGHPEKRAVILADLHGVGDTHIRVVANGAVTTLAGLPNANGVLDLALREYDVADAQTIGTFLRWARQTFPAEVATLAYVGHGTPLPPETDFGAIFGPASAWRTPHAPLPPLPTNIGANPDFTDMHMPAGSPRDYNILTPYALARALAMATASGNLPFHVVDMVMCFAASIEEFYEIAPFTEFITGSPNYAFFDPTGPGQVLAAINGAMTPAAMASTIIQTYHALLPPTDHPRILAAVDSTKLAGVKQSWDETAAALHALLTDPGQRPSAMLKLRDAYLASLKYDLTYCPPPEWELTTPDGLVDLRHFALQLTQQFSGTAVAGLANATAERIRGATDPAVTDRAALNGLPWFDSTPLPWIFDGSNPSSIDDDAAGLSIYADLVGRPISPTLTELSWHAHWYHDDNSIADNPQPFAFLADGAPGLGWDEVFQEYWDGQTTRTAACIPDLEPARSGDEVLDDLQAVALQPAAQVVTVGAPVRLALVVSTLRLVRPSLVRFQVLNAAEETIFEDVVNTGPLPPGIHQISATRIWVPDLAGGYTIKAVADADNRIIEASEGNNSRDAILAAVSRPGQPPLLAGGTAGDRQFFPTRTVPLSLSLVAGSQPLDRLVIQTYQFVAGPDGIQLPVLIGKETLFNPILPDVTATLPQATRPGAVVLHVWGGSSAGRSLAPLAVRLNYAPANAAIAGGATHVYRLDAARGDRLGFVLNVGQGDADLLLWEPFIDDGPTQRAVAVGSDAIQIDFVPLGGRYALGVSAKNQATTYSLQPTRNGAPMATPRRESGAGAFDLRPQFIEPIADPPALQVFIPLLARQ